MNSFEYEQGYLSLHKNAIFCKTENQTLAKDMTNFISFLTQDSEYALYNSGNIWYVMKPPRNKDSKIENTRKEYVPDKNIVHRPQIVIQILQKVLKNDQIMDALISESDDLPNLISDIATAINKRKNLEGTSSD